jgi:hypothetical protein
VQDFFFVGIVFVLPGEKETFLANPAHERSTGISAKGAVAAGAFERVTHPEDMARQRPLTAKFQNGEID